MKHAGTLTIILSILVLVFSVNSYAQDVSAQVSALEKRAERIQSQIEQAKQASASNLEQQIKMLQGSVSGLTERRVQIDAQIASIEGQIEKLRSNSESVLNRQMDHYNTELNTVKQQISSIVSQKKAEPTVPGPESAVKPPVQPPVVAPAAPVPAAKPPCANCPADPKPAPSASIPGQPAPKVSAAVVQEETKATQAVPPAPAN